MRIVPAGELRDRITLQAPVFTDNEVGEQEISYSNVFTVWARVRPRRIGEVARLRQQQLQSDWEFIIRFLPQINCLWRIQFGGKSYNIDTIADIDARGIYQELSARLIDSGDYSRPFNTVAPVISPSGTSAVGTTLSVTTGAWTGAPTSFAYQWYRGELSIDGATSNTLITTETGIHTCIVTGTNDIGSGIGLTAGVSIA